MADRYENYKRPHPKLAKSYITIGDPYGVDKRQDEKDKGDKARKSLPQFLTTVPKKGQTEGYFTKLTYQGEPFWDMPEKDGKEKEKSVNKGQKGFGSSDGNRRSEFSHTLPTLRWKELLTKEYDIHRMHAERNEQIRTQAQGDNSENKDADSLDQLQRTIDAQQGTAQRQYFQSTVPRLYSIGRHEEGITPFCNKCTKNTFFCSHRVGTGAYVSKSCEFMIDNCLFFHHQLLYSVML